MAQRTPPAANMIKRFRAIGDGSRPELIGPAPIIEWATTSDQCVMQGPVSQYVYYAATRMAYEKALQAVDVRKATAGERIASWIFRRPQDLTLAERVYDRTVSRGGVQVYLRAAYERVSAFAKKTTGTAETPPMIRKAAAYDRVLGRIGIGGLGSNDALDILSELEYANLLHFTADTQATRVREGYQVMPRLEPPLPATAPGAMH